MDTVTSAVTSTLEKLHILPPPKSAGAPLVHPSPEQVSELRQKYKEQSQDHVFTFWDSLDVDEQAQLYAQLLSIDPVRVTSITETVLSPKAKEPETPVESQLAPLPAEHCASTMDASPEKLSEWRSAGLKLIAEGKVAVLLMAGGQGTRLGSSAPKGCYDIGLPSGKSLFQLQAERLVKLQQVAAEEAGDRTSKVVIPWYIMTSGPTRKDTEDFLRSKGYFGLEVYPPPSTNIRKKTSSSLNRAFSLVSPTKGK
jgi:UDP-N-acetylglucosamine/UDP-N-acetylgalactosamine diphosphorylase